MNQHPSQAQPSYLTLAVVILLGVLARLLLPWLGHNYDVDSWETVANLVREGKNVFAWTDRHNYGPGLFPVFAFAKTISLLLPWKHPESFHFAVAFILTLADLGIFVLLAKRAGTTAAALFFLSPISILITGFHSQVDNLAIFLGFAAWLVLEASLYDRKKLILSALLMGLSLVIKHDFILLPIWFLFDPRWTNRSEKTIYAFAVYAIFIGSFLPFCGNADAEARIIKNVFQYTMGSGNSLLSHLTQVVLPLPLLFQWMNVDVVLKWLFMAIMVLAGRFVMKREPANSFYLYLACLIVFSPQMADQYLAIPVLTCAVFYKNRWLMLYTLVCTLFILGSPFNLYLWPRLTGYAFLTSVYKNGFWWYYHCQIWMLFFVITRYLQLRSKPNYSLPDKALC